MTEIIDKASKFSIKLLKENLPPSNIYHNINHTKEVVKNCNEIGRNCNLNDIEFEILILSAWFHDTGFIKSYYGHENISAEIAEDFLKRNNYKSNRAKKVKECIIKTNILYLPENKLEKILCEADLLYLSKPKFMRKANILRKEWENIGKFYSEKEWITLNINFMKNRSLFTKYGKEKYTVQREKNIKYLESLYKNLTN